MSEAERSPRGIVRFVPFLVVALLALGVGVVVASPWDGDESEPTVKPDEFYGITPQTELDSADFERMAEAGVGTVRVALNWNAIQHQPGECRSDFEESACNWSAIDELIGGAASHGVRVMPILGGARGFGGDEPPPEEARIEHPPTAGADFEDWKDFVAAAVDRYGAGGAFWTLVDEYGGEPLPVRVWQIWNEPNAEQYWPPEPNPAEYATLVDGASEAIRSADPKAEIVLAGLFGTSALESPEFLRELYAVEGLEDGFDSIAIHPYSPNLHGIEVQVEWAREVAEAAGDSDVGIWVTELGWSSAQGDHPLEIGPAGQAEMITRSLDLLRRKRDAWNVRGVVLYTWQDRLDEGVCEFCREAGLFDSSGEPKEAWESFARAAGGESGGDAPLESADLGFAR